MVKYNIILDFLIWYVSMATKVDDDVIHCIHHHNDCPYMVIVTGHWGNMRSVWKLTISIPYMGKLSKDMVFVDFI